ncbi:MAG: ATP-dependent helicase, partial [Sutterella sp.]
MTHFKPRPYQDLIMRHMIGTPRGMVWAGMGMGKTASTLFALDALKRCSVDIFPVLILAPLRVAASTWPDEVEKWKSDLT